MTLPSPSTPSHDFPVLVVHLDRNLCVMIVEILTLEGYRADMAVLGFDTPSLAAEAALRTLEQATEPTIILAEPWAFELKTTKALGNYLKDVERRAPHVVFLLTAMVEDAAQRMVERVHADGILAQPFTVEQLLDVVEKGEGILGARAQQPPRP